MTREQHRVLAGDIASQHCPLDLGLRTTIITFGNLFGICVADQKSLHLLTTHKKSTILKQNDADENDSVRLSFVVGRNFIC